VGIACLMPAEGDPELYIDPLITKHPNTRADFGAGCKRRRQTAGPGTNDESTTHTISHQTRLLTEPVHFLKLGMYRWARSKKNKKLLKVQRTEGTRFKASNRLGNRCHSSCKTSLK